MGPTSGLKTLQNPLLGDVGIPAAQAARALSHQHTRGSAKSCDNKHRKKRSLLADELIPPARSLAQTALPC